MTKPRFSKDLALEVSNHIFQQLIRDGDIDPTGKNPKQLFTAFKRIVQDDRYSFHPVIDYTRDLLRTARQYAKEGNGLEALTFYATWVEHTLNGMIVSLGKRFHIQESLSLDLVRHTRVHEKLVWIHLLLQRRAPSRIHLLRLRQIADARNQFIHYKWRAEPEPRIDYRPQFASAEKVVMYLKRFQNKHLFYGQRSKLKFRNA